MKFIPTVYETNPTLNNHIPALHKHKNLKCLHLYTTNWHIQIS